MIDCEIYESGTDHLETIGGSGARFAFNTLPRIGDILWLQLGMGEQISVTVEYVAQWVSCLVENNHGYIVVRLNEENQHGLI